MTNINLIIDKRILKHARERNEARSNMDKFKSDSFEFRACKADYSAAVTRLNEVLIIKNFIDELPKGKFISEIPQEINADASEVPIVGNVDHKKL